MTEEVFLCAKRNREERAAKLEQYNDISKMHDRTSDSDFIILDEKCVTGKMIYPTQKEFRDFLKTIRNRLDAEISVLDEEFSGL